MTSLKDVARNSQLIPTTDAPVQIIDQSAITAVTERMKVIVPDAAQMTNYQLATIAQESILYRTVPGRDVHYFLNRGKLSRVLDYKYLKTFADFKEQMLSSDNSAVVEDTYRALSEQEKIAAGIPVEQIASECTLITQRERKVFAAEVRQWIDMGFSGKDALAIAKDVTGDLGTRAIGAVAEKDKYNNMNAPEGWSPLQKAEKLAFKNAVNRKYGQPTADEMAAMAYRMASRAMPEDWAKVDPTESREIQARYADLEASAREVKEIRAGRTDEENAAIFKKHNDLLHGNEDEIGIGDDPVEDAEFTAPDWADVEEVAYEQLQSASGDAPDVFKNVSAAIDWGMKSGVFNAPEHAKNAYNKLKAENKPASAKEMRDLWVNNVQERIALKAAPTAESLADTAALFDTDAPDTGYSE